MKTTNLDPEHQLDVTRGRKNPERAGSSGVTVRDGSTTAGPVWDITVVGGTWTDNGDGTAVLTIGDVPGLGVPQWFNVQDYGALGDGTTDDTVAIQDTIDAAVAAGGGTVYFPPGVYIVGGALQDTGAFNGQLLLPDVDHADLQITITFRGALRPPFHPVYGLDTADFPGGYSVLKSTLTGASGSASVFSGGNDVTPSYLGGGNNLNVVVDDLICLGPNNPTFTFWNFQACNGCGIGALQISTTGAFAGSATTPTNSNAYGIKLPQAYFSNGTPVETLSVGGFYSGVYGGELATYHNLILGPLINGLVIDDMLYPSTVLRMTSTAVARVIVATGSDPRRLDVLSYNRESQTTGVPFETEADLDDASDLIEGYIRWHCTETGGTPHTFILNGGDNVLTEEMGPTWGASLIIKDEGSPLATAATSIDFVGAGVVASGTGAAKTVTIAGNTSTVATDAIWDTAGDLAVATGADAAAKLAIGNAGAKLSRINGTVQWDSRTSMPTAATGDRVWRSDLFDEYYYNGTIWLSTTAREMAFPLAAAPPLTGTGVLHRMIIPAALGGSDTYLAAVLTAFYVAGGTALSGSHKWVGTVSKANTAGAASLGTITIASGASDQWRPGTALSINAAADVASGYVALEINWVKTGTPGSLYANCSMAYRTIAT